MTTTAWSLMELMNKQMDGVYELILRAKDGRERRTLAWLPNEQVRKNFYDRAHKKGLEVIDIKEEIESKNIKKD